jgi:protein phosphatase PTC7
VRDKIGAFQKMRKGLLIVVIAVVPALGFAPPSPLCVVVRTSNNPRASNSRLWSTKTPDPLATEGDWSAYIDTDRTGYVYYFNGVTGESLWEPPTTTFPVVTAPESTKEERRAERKKRREQKKLLDQSAIATTVVEPTTNSEEKKGRGGLFNLFGGGGSNTDTTTTIITPTTSSKKQQLLELGKIANNDEFLTNVDAVIAEAQEAIAIAAKVNDKSIIQTTKNKEDTPPSSSTVLVEENNNIWVEGLKNLFKNTFDAFIPPPLTTTMSEEEEKKKATFFPGTTNEKKKKEIQVVAKVETPNKEKKKANVSNSDFLDVIWGAETSARPTLNIVEMMKAFQIRSTETNTAEVRGPLVDEKSIEFRTLTLDAALEVRAHPEKVSWGGEDAGFIAGRTFGVFDGVSGATKVKGKKLYSRCLAETMKKSVGSKTTSTSTTSSSSSSLGGGEKKLGGAGGAGLSVREMTDYLIEAKKLADVEATGASTAVIASIGEDNILRALNIGDSVCLVLRNGAVAARTREIIHYFDCPYQLGDDSPDRPSDGTTLQAEIFGGDIIVAGSDGVFDNLSDADVCEIVNSFGPRTKSAMIAKKIVDRSRTVSLDTNSVTPYSTVARGKTGYAAYKNGRGGKVDDISCLVVKAS